MSCELVVLINGAGTRDDNVVAVGQKYKLWEPEGKDIDIGLSSVCDEKVWLLFPNGAKDKFELGISQLR